MDDNSEEGDADMSWEHDSPVVFSKDPRTFAEYSKEPKRTFDDFAIGEKNIQYSRVVPSDTTTTPTVDPSTAFNSPFTNDPEQSAGGSEGTNTRLWNIIVKPCIFLCKVAIGAATHPINLTAWRTVYGTTKYILCRTERIEETFTAIEEIAGGTKRRIVLQYANYCRNRIDRSQQTRRRRQFNRERRAGGLNHEHSPPAALQSNQTAVPVTHELPEGYYMSGALPDPVPRDTPSPSYPQSMPGAWYESPATDNTRFADNALYWNDTPDDIISELANADDNVNAGQNVSAEDAMAVDLSATDDINATNNAWPYYPDDNNVKLSPVDTDDEDSMMTTDGTLEQGSSFEPKGPDFISSPDSEDNAMADADSSELESLTSDQDNPVHDYYKYHNNKNPDAIQRAFVEEAHAILEEDDEMSEYSIDQDSSISSDLSSLSSLSGSTPDQSPLAVSNFSTSTASTQDSAATHWKTSPKDSPAWSHVDSPDNGLLEPSPHSSVRHPIQPPVRFTPYQVSTYKAVSPKKRVTFYASPTTGRPIDKYKKYLKGERMDVSYVSVSTDDGCSMLSDIGTRAQLPTSPTYQEQREQQLLIEQKDRELLQSRSSFLSPVDAHPHIPAASPLRALSQITNWRARQRRGTTSLSVTPAGSPMMLQSSDIASSEHVDSLADGTLVLTKKSLPGKENYSPLNQADVSANSSVIGSTPNHDSTPPLAPVKVMIPALAEENVAHGKQCSSPKEGSPSNQATSIATNPEIVSEGTLAHGKDALPNTDCSQSNQIEPSDTPNTPSPSLSQDLTMHYGHFNTRGFTPSHQLDNLHTTGTPEDSSAEETPDNGKDTTISPSTRVEALAAASTPEPSVTRETPDNEKDIEPTVSPSTRVESPVASSTPNPSVTKGTLVLGKDPASAKRGSSPSDQVDASATPSPSSITRQLEGLNVSGRRKSLRFATRTRKDEERRAAKEAEIAAEKARKEKEEAEEKARKKKELEEERKRTGVRRKPVENIIRPLSDAWEAKVDEVMHEPMAKVITTSVAMTEITRRDLGKVLPQPGVPGEDPRGWLNDTIISAYLDTAVDHALAALGHKRGDIPKHVALSTYFYPKLKENGAQSVSRWIKRLKIDGKKLLEVQHIYIPVNHGGMHWTLLVISPKFKLIEYFDSFHGNADQVIRNAKALLRFELQDAFKDDEWTAVGVGGPTQTNGQDCGVFVSTTAKMISLGVDPMAYSAADIPLQRRRIVAELMNRGFDGELAPDVKFPDD